MRRIAISLFIITIILSPIILPSPGRSCLPGGPTVMDNVKWLFWFPGGSGEGYPYCTYAGWHLYALGFVIEPHENPDFYWITLYRLDVLPNFPPYPYTVLVTPRECFHKDDTEDWPWDYGEYGPDPEYPFIDHRRNFGITSCDQKAGNPVNLGTGNKFQQEVDFTVKTPGPELAFKRFYNSQSTYNGPLGYGWTHNYNLFIEDEENRVVVWDADGKALYFKKEGGGSFSAEPLVYDTLTQEGGGTGDYVFTRKDNTIYRFNSQGRPLSIKDLNDNQIVLTYQGNLLTNVSNNFGREITLTYTPNNKIETVSDPKGNTYTFSYTGDNLTGMSSPDVVSTEYAYGDPNDPHNMTEKRVAGETVGTWGYDQHDRAISSGKAGGVEEISVTYGGTGIPDVLEVTVTDSRGYERTYQFWSRYGILRVKHIGGSGCSSCPSTNKAYNYDKESFALIQILIQITEEKLNTTDFTRDARGNILTKTEASGTALEQTTTYTYHPTFNLVETITVESVAKPGQEKVTTFSYDADGNLTSKTVSGYIGTTQYQYTTSYEYNSAGQLTYLDGPRTDVSDTTHYSYDPATGDLLSIGQHQVGFTYYSDYDQNGNVGTVTDPNGVATIYTYDERNRVKTITSQADGSTTQYFYDSRGNIDYLLLPEGNTIDYTHDSAGRLTRVEDNLGNAIVYGYDSESNKTREEIRDSGEVVRKYLDFEYDEGNRLKKIINPDSTYTEFDYDGNGNRTSMRDPRGNTTDYEYDELNRLIEMSQYIPPFYTIQTTYSYDAHDNLSSIEDGNTNVTHYTYDDFGRVTVVTSPDTGTTTYRHDEAGNLTEKTDARDITVTYTYDHLNRLASIGLPDTGAIISHFSYDSPFVSHGKGRLTGMLDQSGTYSYHYGPRGTLIKEVKTIDGFTYTTEYAYNKNDTLTSIDYPTGGTVTYDLDGVGRISEVTTTLGGTPETVASNIKYLPYGGITELTYGNGLVRTQGYDLQYRAASIQAGSILNLAYSPDPNGNITSITDALDSARNQSFGYDELNRLTSGSGIYGQISYTYDFVGNRETKTVNGQIDNYIYEPSTNRLDEITGANPMEVDLDAAGNTERMGTKQFLYNENNRIKKALVDGNTVAKYVYNGHGQRTILKRPGKQGRQDLSLRSPGSSDRRDQGKREHDSPVSLCG
jgi:YD repeat-containing protein